MFETLAVNHLVKSGHRQRVLALEIRARWILPVMFLAVLGVVALYARAYRYVVSMGSGACLRDLLVKAAKRHHKPVV